jgi:hypothetical protein
VSPGWQRWTYPADVDQLTSVTVGTLAESQSEGTERAEILQLDTGVVAEPVEGVGAYDSTRLARCLDDWTSMRLGLNTGNRLDRRGFRSHYQRSVLTGVEAAQQLDGGANVILGNSVADGADLSIGEGRVASQDHKVE